MKEEPYRIISPDFQEAYRLVYLIRAFILKKLSAREREELDGWLEQSDANIALFESLTDDENEAGTLALYEQMREDDALRRLKNRIPFAAPRQRSAPSKLWLPAAAVFVALLGIGLYVYWRRGAPVSEPLATTVKQTGLTAEQIRPGGKKAVLVTAAGNQLVLDSAANGALAVGAAVTVEKSDGQISYPTANKDGPAASAMQTLITPKGGQYRVTLSDGTRVWLNAASSLRYPAAFAGNERVVELTGEGYFEVAHGTKPFRVKLSNYTVEDIGTAFDINAYKDEGFDKTTLTEGSAKLIMASASKILVRGQQANVKGGKIDVMTGDTEAVKGWMSGKFVYHFASLDVVLKDAERWYNIPIENKQKSSAHLKATIDRNIPLSQLIKILEVTADVHCKWDGTKLIVLP